MELNKKRSNNNVKINNGNKKVNNNGIKEVFKSNIGEYKKFYKENLKVKHIVVAIIMIILFFILLKMQLDKIDSLSDSNFDKSSIVKNSFFDSILKEEIPINFMIIFAGISPYLYVSLLGVFATNSLILNLVASYLLNKSFFTIILCCIGGIIKIIAYSLSISTGIYYCSLSTKRFRYSQVSFFGFSDFKKVLYQIRGNKKKAEEMDKLKDDKMKKRESLNVKVPYKLFAISYVISILISIVGTIFLR